MMWKYTCVIDANVWLMSAGGRHYRIIERFDAPNRFTAEERGDDDKSFCKIMDGNTISAAMRACQAMATANV